jgi:hypothetical protein
MSSGVQPKHVRVRFCALCRHRPSTNYQIKIVQLLLSNGGELDEKGWQQYFDRMRIRKSGPLRREDMLLCFAKRLDYDTVESGRETLDSDSSISTMQIDHHNSSKRATAPHMPLD